jgi:hypothetical protein
LPLWRRNPFLPDSAPINRRNHSLSSCPQDAHRCCIPIGPFRIENPSHGFIGPT